MTSVLAIASGLVVLLGLIYTSFKLVVSFTAFRRKARLLAETIPGNKAHWLFGHLLEYPGPNDAGLAWQRETTGKYPRVSLAWIGPFLYQIVVCHPDSVRQILKTTEPKGEYTYNLIRKWVGDGLLLSKGSKWHRNRRLLTPAFHFDILRPYMVVNNQAADILINKVRSFSEQEEYFDVFTEISLYTLDVILRCAFSYTSDCQTIGDKHPYVQAVDTMSRLATERFFRPWVHNDFIYKLTPSGRRFEKACDYVHQVATDIIENRKQELTDSPIIANGDRKRYLDFLDILLTANDEDGKGLTDMEIRDEVDTFLFEGHDTTASAICWTLYSLAQHPEHQSRIQEELDDLLKGRQSEEILWEDLPKLTYLTMCLKEALRLHSPVSFIQRQNTQPFTIGDINIPEDSLINIVIYNLHHNPLIWDNSLEYRPSRFTPEEIEKRDPYAFVPFSAGPRNCIGQNFAMHEMKVVLARLLYRFTFQLHPTKKVSKRVELVVRSDGGIWLKAVPR